MEKLNNIPTKFTHYFDTTDKKWVIRESSARVYKEIYFFGTCPIHGDLFLCDIEHEGKIHTILRKCDLKASTPIRLRRRHSHAK